MRLSELNLPSLLYRRRIKNRHDNGTYPKNISAVKKGEPKKVQVTERTKDVISLWGQEEKLYQLSCVYRTPVYKVNSFNISCKLSKDTISLANT